MEIVVVCAQCAAEYGADADGKRWTCPKCGHEAENRHYPFLTRRVAHAKSHRAETDWEAMFDEVVASARDKVLALEGKVERLEEENRNLRRAPPNAP